MVTAKLVSGWEVIDDFRTRGSVRATRLSSICGQGPRRELLEAFWPVSMASFRETRYSAQRSKTHIELEGHKLVAVSSGHTRTNQHKPACMSGTWAWSSQVTTPYNGSYLYLAEYDPQGTVA